MLNITQQWLKPLYVPFKARSALQPHLYLTAVLQLSRLSRSEFSRGSCWISRKLTWTLNATDLSKKRALKSLLVLHVRSRECATLSFFRPSTAFHGDATNGAIGRYYDYLLCLHTAATTSTTTILLLRRLLLLLSLLLMLPSHVH